MTNLVIEKIKKLESPPKIVKNIFSSEEIKEFLKLYNNLPVTVHNKKQNVIKKRWLKGYSKKLEDIFHERLKKEIGSFKMDNLKDENDQDILGLIQESYSPIGLHVDGGFDLNNQIYKQTLIPLSSVGSTVIFKNRFYDGSTVLLKIQRSLKTNLKYGQNKRSDAHLKLFNAKHSIRKFIKNFYNMKILII